MVFITNKLQLCYFCKFIPILFQCHTITMFMFSIVPWRFFSINIKFSTSVVCLREQIASLLNAHYLESNQSRRNPLLYLFICIEDVDSTRILFPDRMITWPFSQMGEVYITTPILKDQVWSSVGRFFWANSVSKSNSLHADIFQFFFINWSIF